MQFRRHAMMWMTLLLVAMGVDMGVAQDNSLPALPAFGDDSVPRDPSFSQAPAQLGGMFPSRASSDSASEASSSDKRFVTIRYVVERPVGEQVIQNNKAFTITHNVREARVARIEVDKSLDELDLPPDGKRAAVLAVTAARHDDLLQTLKEAKDDDERKVAAEALKANYTEHFAIETWWREQRLAELEQRLEEMRGQVKARQDSQEKYIEAAMTIAQLWAKGIAIAPPKPGSGSASGVMPPNVPGPLIAPVPRFGTDPAVLPGPSADPIPFRPADTGASSRGSILPTLNPPPLENAPTPPTGNSTTIDAKPGY